MYLKAENSASSPSKYNWLNRRLPSNDNSNTINTFQDQNLGWEEAQVSWWTTTFFQKQEKEESAFPVATGTGLVVTISKEYWQGESYCAFKK